MLLGVAIVVVVMLFAVSSARQAGSRVRAAILALRYLR
jgi:hypothetical protein